MVSSSGHSPPMSDMQHRSPSLAKMRQKSSTSIKLFATAAHLGSVLFVMPFSDIIMNAPRPRKVKIPSLELYNGNMDHEELMGVYEAQIYVHNMDDTACCRHFRATLQEVGQKWCNGLTPGSVACFYELCDCFVSEFITSCRERRTSIHLLKISIVKMI